MDGSRCCRTRREGCDGRGCDVMPLCDGSELGIDSICCETDSVECENDICTNYEDAIHNDQGNIN